MPWWLWLFVIALSIYLLRKRDARANARSTNKKAAGKLLAASIPANVHEWPELGEYDFAIVGESHYQDALRSIVGTTNGERTRVTTSAVLSLEDDNPYDDKAVGVSIDGLKVGYLSRENARSFRRRISALKLAAPHSRCGAQISGGGTAESGETRDYGVWLDLKPFGR